MKKYCIPFKYYMIFIIACLISLQNSYADPILNFFFYPYPDIETDNLKKDNSSDINNFHADNFHATVKKTGHIAFHRLHGALNHNRCAGIMSTYFGYLSVSNSDGQTFFPIRHHRAEKYVYIVITDAVVPVVMFGNTVNNLEFDKHAEAAYFKVTKKQDDKTGLFFWDVQEAERPSDNKIPSAESIVIIAKPEYIYVPIGISPADNSPDFLLPPMYVKRGIHSVENSFHMMTRSHFFSPLRISYQKSPTLYRMQPII
jgi:hypothetical protein